uniref:Uncharacterized protein n=1 Tax=Lactuca sativa TaxID=4236 RepID=A0A9R1UVK1_LACSA|nr:hypothetical protein LSAT_V11C700357580 [Lactuca sativa]
MPVLGIQKLLDLQNRQPSNRDPLYQNSSCFQALFFCQHSASLLLQNFCIYHITPPGHELGAATICMDDPVPSVEDLSDQILVVLNHFR